MRMGYGGLLVLLLGLSACNAEQGTVLLGTLEWDRIGVPAEASETVLAWYVAEGERVQAGQLLLELDPRREDARIAQATADVAQAQARLDELSNGARPESIDAAQAVWRRSRASLTVAEQDFTRVQQLYQRALVAKVELDNARARRDQARAELANSAAQLRELTNGTRVEQLDQATAAHQAAQAVLRQLQLNRAHLQVRAPRAGVVDALPFKVGDQPPLGAELVSLLVGEAPYARIFVPASQRNSLRLGEVMQVLVEGVATPLRGTMRQIASEASFTPYYALTGEDASRLVYRAEVLLDGAAARQLPAGLPVRVERRADVQP